MRRPLRKSKEIPSGERCWHFTFTRTMNKFLLTCGLSNEVIVIDAKTLEVIKRIATKSAT